MRRPFAAVLLAAALLPLRGEAQEPTAGSVLNVFLDCQNLSCDFDHLRREIEFVNWVRNREDAQIHVLGVSQGTGAGGEEVTLAFIGRGQFAGRTDTLQFRTGVTDTEDERREALTRMLGLGLVPYVTRTAVAERLRFSYDRPDEDTQASGARDPWNFWVFSISAGGSLEGQQRERQREFNGELEARRVTEAWKISLSVEGSYERREFDLTDDSTFGSTQTDYSAFGETVWSLGPRWSIGGLLDVEQSTFDNYDFSLETGPAIEFSVYPYSQSSRRLITFQYAAGVAAYNYVDSTVFGFLKEMRPIHQLNINVEAQQPWGSIGASAEGRQYLHDLSLHRIDVGGEISLRLFRGFEFNISANFARVKDQINLPAGDLTPEEILIERRLRGTDFEYSTNISFSYTFGSIFNNIVNPRF